MRKLLKHWAIVFYGLIIFVSAVWVLFSTLFTILYTEILFSLDAFTFVYYNIVIFQREEFVHLNVTNYKHFIMNIPTGYHKYHLVRAIPLQSVRQIALIINLYFLNEIKSAEKDYFFPAVTISIRKWADALKDTDTPFVRLPSSMIRQFLFVYSCIWECRIWW